MIAKPAAPTDGTRIDVTQQTQPLDHNRSTQDRNLPKPSITSQAFNRTGNAGTLSQLAPPCYGNHKITRLPDFHNAVLRGRSSVAAEVPVSVANELERLVMEIKFRTKPEK